MGLLIDGILLKAIKTRELNSLPQPVNSPSNTMKEIKFWRQIRKVRVGKRLFDWLLLSNFILVVFASKHFIAPPDGPLDFVFKIATSLLVGAIITGLTLWILQRKALKFVIAVNFFLTILVAMI
jgi:hypothetical protein